MLRPGCRARGPRQECLVGRLPCRTERKRQEQVDDEPPRKDSSLREHEREVDQLPSHQYVDTRWSSQRG